MPSFLFFDRNHAKLNLAAKFNHGKICQVCTWQPRFLVIALSVTNAKFKLGCQVRNWQYSAKLKKHENLSRHYWACFSQCIQLHKKKNKRELHRKRVKSKSHQSHPLLTQKILTQKNHFFSLLFDAFVVHPHNKAVG